MSPSLSHVSPFRPGALFLAPMVELSHRALRELILEYGGLDYAYTEMASAGAAVSGSPFEGCYLDPGPDPSKVVYQLYATKPERLVEALEMLRDRAAVKEAPGTELHPGDRARGAVFGADINFGCSAPHITRSGGGSAWMREPEKAFGLVRLARAAWDRNLSAKIRLGKDDDYERLADFVRGLAEAGVDYVTIHPRLDSQKFRRQGRWDYVARLAAEMPIPIVGNGDIRTWSDYRARLAESRVSGIMIGREAVRRPWIFALIAGKELDSSFSLEIDLLECALRMLDLIESRLVPEFRLSRAQRFFSYYADNFSFAHHLKYRVVNQEGLGAMRRELEAYFQEVPGDRIRCYID